MTDFTTLRKNYPLLQQCTYLNTANAGAVSEATTNKGVQYLEDFSRFASQMLPQWLKQMEETRDVMARWLNARPEEIGLVWDTSYSISWTEKMLDPGLEVVLVEHDFPAAVLPWIHSGRKVHWISWDLKGDIDLAEIEKALSGKPKVLCISHVQYTNGYRIDLEALSAICRRHGAFLIVDAIQSLGVFRIDPGKLGIDVLAASSYKWQTAGYGAGMMYIRKEARKWLKHGALGSGSMTDFLQDPRKVEYLKQPPQSLEAGHPKILHVLMQGNALRELEAIGWDSISIRVKELSDLLYAAIRNAGYTPMAPRNDASWSGIVSFECDKALNDHLKEQQVIATWRPSYLRTAIHFYNNEADVERLSEALGSF